MASDHRCNRAARKHDTAADGALKRALDRHFRSANGCPASGAGRVLQPDAAGKHGPIGLASLKPEDPRPTIGRYRATPNKRFPAERVRAFCTRRLSECRRQSPPVGNAGVPSANIPTGHANGAGASPTRSPRRPARSRQPARDASRRGPREAAAADRLGAGSRSACGCGRRRGAARVLRQDTALRQVHGHALALGRLDTA